jgi:hypothetical protein
VSEAECGERGHPEEESKRLRAMQLEALRRDVQIGIEQAERGEVIDGDVVFRRLRTRIDAMARNRA